MITAKKAKQLSISSEKCRDNDSFKHLLEQIEKQATEKVPRYITVDILSEKHKEKLIKLGFSIEPQYFVSEGAVDTFSIVPLLIKTTEYKISW